MKRLGEICLVAVATLLIGCGGAKVQPSASPSTLASSDRLPAWLQEEAAWQALASGDAHPGRCRWTLTTMSRAATLDGGSTAYLHILGAHSRQRVYVVVLDGRFMRSDSAAAGVASALYLVLLPNRYYLATGLAARHLELRRLGRLRSFALTLPVSSGVWGHTLFEGGPAPGGPVPIPHVEVGVWAGSHTSLSGPPLRTVRSNGNGFFVLDLPPGTYTFRLLAKDHGWPSISSVTVTAGRPVAAGVYGQAP